MEKPLIVALTPRGEQLGLRLAGAIGQAQVVLARAGAADRLREAFTAGRPLVCVMALGIVVRVLGPLTRDKHHEPPVVVIDEAGRFVIPVLGGHIAGANALAEEAARALGAVAVVTTASEALGLPAVDLIGRDRGWKVEALEPLTAVAAAVVRGEHIGVWQDAGRRDRWLSGAWPDSFVALDRWPPQGDWAGLLVISDRTLPPAAAPTVVYRPPSLALGVGCRRGVPSAEIEELFQALCSAEALAPLSLGVVASATLKENEPGLREFAERHGVAFRTFTAEELESVGPTPTPSETVRARVGVAGVAEPAALLAAGTRELLVTKRRGRRVTMAVARREDV
jgi:cobalamin biosynthesis protein CbiG